METHLCLHGSNRIVAFRSKQSVQESSRTLNLRSCSKNKCRGRTILSCSLRYACELKLSNERLVGGYRKGSEPKLKRHCWNDMQEAAAKNPSLVMIERLANIKHYTFLQCFLAIESISICTYFALPKTCLRMPPSTPFRLNITSCASKSSRQPNTEPPCHEGKSCGIDFALCHIKRRHPSKAIE